MLIAVCARWVFFCLFCLHSVLSVSCSLILVSPLLSLLLLCILFFLCLHSALLLSWTFWNVDSDHTCHTFEDNTWNRSVQEDMSWKCWPMLWSISKMIDDHFTRRNWAKNYDSLRTNGIAATHFNFLQHLIEFGNTCMTMHLFLWVHANELKPTNKRKKNKPNLQMHKLLFTHTNFECSMAISMNCVSLWARSLMVLFTCNESCKSHC